MNRLTYYPVKNNCSDSKACTLRGEEATLLTREEVGLKNLSTRLPSQDQPADACRRESSSVTHTEEISSSLRVKPHKERRRNAVVPLLPFLLRAPTHIGSIQLSQNMDVRSRAYSVEGRAPEHRPREAQRAACRSAAGRRAVARRWRPPARSLRGRSGL